MHPVLRAVASKRGIHTVPRLPNADVLRKQGIPNLFSAVGFNVAWDQQQKHICEKLTTVTSGTSLESYLPFHILLNTAKRPFQANIFNLASSAHNNHLFIENILPANNNVETQPSRLFLSRVESSCDGTWDDLKKEMIVRAEEDVLGQGWLFLVENSHKELHVLTVQNNGTPYYFPRNQLFDLNSAISLDEFSQIQEIKKAVQVQEQKNNSEKVTDWTMPLICVNLWDHAYLHDYGIQNRSKYVENVLNNLNWAVINNRLFTDPHK